MLDLYEQLFGEEESSSSKKLKQKRPVKRQKRTSKKLDASLRESLFGETYRDPADWANIDDLMAAEIHRSSGNQDFEGIEFGSSDPFEDL